LNLTSAQRRQVLQGNCTSLLFPYEAGQPTEVDCTVVLEWEDERRDADQFGNVTVVPPRPVHWIVVTSVKRHRKGDWQVRFNTNDLREHPRYLAAGGGYTSSRFRAIDELEVPDPKYVAKVAKEASDEWGAIRKERAIAARQQWRQTRRSAQREFSHIQSRFPAAA
jgi:hypothetical protein